MRNQPDDVYGAPPSAGPLFESVEPPSPSGDLAVLYALIAEHRGRTNPISIREICELRPSYFHSARQVKDLVQELRVIHHKVIGSRRGVPSGYFLIVDIKDLQETLNSYRNQAVEMFRVIRALAGPAITAEMLGQIKLEVA